MSVTAKKLYQIIETARRAERNWDMHRYNSTRNHIDYGIGKAIEIKESVSLANWSMFNTLMNQIENYTANEKLKRDEHTVFPDMNKSISERGQGRFIPMHDCFDDIFRPKGAWHV